jgi:hypothetical protein
MGIIGKIEFYPNEKSERPSITVASVRTITDPAELQQIEELLADPEKLKAHNAQRLTDALGLLGRPALEGLLEAISEDPGATPSR